MLRHVVFFSARNRADVERLYEGLLLLTQITHGRVEIGRNLGIDTLSAPVDFVVYGEFADEAELEETYATERHLLYVACTRARDQLLVTSVAPASEFLDDLRG